MRLLIDFGSIKTGGGVQLATNFLKNLKSLLANQKIDFIAILKPSKGPLAAIDLSEFCNLQITYPDSYLARIYFENTKLNTVVITHKIDTFFTFFGAGLPKYQGVKSVVSVAYPIICYQESQYWNYLPLIPKLKKQVINHFRRKRIRQADIVITETSVMKERLEKFAGVDHSKLVVSPPSPSLFVEENAFNPNMHLHSPKKILLLGGDDPHKNIWRLPEIAKCLNDLGCSNFQFVLSISKNQFIDCLSKMQAFVEFPEQYFSFIGSIPADRINSVYASSDFLMNISDLESFSNNYMEAWKAGLPLICSNRDFSRNICGNSAIYIEPHDPENAAAAIVAFMDDLDLQLRLTSAGKENLKQLPTLEEKCAHVFSILGSLQHA